MSPPTIATMQQVYRAALEAFTAGDVEAFITTNALEFLVVRDSFLCAEVLRKQDVSFWLSLAEKYPPWRPIATVMYWAAEGATEAATAHLFALEPHNDYTPAASDLWSLVLETYEAIGGQETLEAIQEGASESLFLMHARTPTPVLTSGPPRLHAEQ